MDLNIYKDFSKIVSKIILLCKVRLATPTKSWAAHGRCSWAGETKAMGVVDYESMRRMGRQNIGLECGLRAHRW
jgi:hypothetical protein